VSHGVHRPHRFGSTQSSSSSGSSGGVSAVLQAVAAELQAHEGRPVSTAWLRAGQQLELQLTPQRWDGRGLLGCHLRPL
jgi:26S proteasome non-ATPase regulatory subunit 9